MSKTKTKVREPTEGFEPSTTVADYQTVLKELLKANPQLRFDRSFFDQLPAGRNFKLPKRAVRVPNSPEEIPATCGLHLLMAPAASGKTITALGLAVWLADFVPVTYVYAYEPLAEIGISDLTADAHTKLMEQKLDAQSKTPKFVVFDSLSMALRMLTEVKPVADTLGDQAYTGGLKAADLVGAAAHSLRAASANTALYATINSEMLPIVKALGGAVMGVYHIPAPGLITGTDRDDREIKPISVPKEAMNIACLANNYGPFKGASNTTQGRI